MTLTWKHHVLHGSSKKRWRRHQDTEHWVDMQLAQQRGLKFYQTRSNAIILCDTLPAYCILKVITMESGEIIYEKEYASPRPPPKISFKDNWMKGLDSKVAGGSEDFQQISKSKTQLSRTERPVSEQPPGLLTQEIEKDVLFGCESTNSRTGRPVNAPSFSQSCVSVSVECVDKDKDVHENVDADQIRTVRPVESEQSVGLFTQREQMDMDFRVAGLPHAVVKQAENFRVRELVKKIESHPHRRALQADLQHNNACTPFSDEAKAMILEMCNVELFELCETIPKVHCSRCLLHWNQGIAHCTCGHLLKESESSQSRTTSWRRGRLRGARHDKTEAQEEHFVAQNARRRCLTKKFEGIHDRFLRDQVYRDSQLRIGWTEQKCIEMNKLAQEDHSYSPSRDEFKRYQKKNIGISHWTNRARTHRCDSDQDFRAAVTFLNRLHRESGEERTRTNPFSTVPKVTPFFLKFFMVELGLKKWWKLNIIFWICCSRFVYSWWQSAATDGRCKQYTSHVTFFSYTMRELNDVHSHHGSRKCGPPGRNCPSHTAQTLERFRREVWMGKKSQTDEDSSRQVKLSKTGEHKIEGDATNKDVAIEGLWTVQKYDPQAPALVGGNISKNEMHTGDCWPVVIQTMIAQFAAKTSVGLSSTRQRSPRE